MKPIVLLAALALSALVHAAPPMTDKDRKPHNGSTPAQIDAFAGLGAHRDAEQNAFSRELVAKARREGGTVMISEWVWQGKPQFYAMRRNADGSWSGPNAPMGYYTAKRKDTIVSYPRK